MVSSILGCVRKDFATWLRKNRARMPVQLLAGRRLRDGAEEFTFPGVSPCLRVWVGRTAFEVVVIYRRQHMDIVAEFDVFLKKNARGLYYCDGCRTNGNTRYERTRMDLIAAHSFEPFREWCEENIRGDRRLLIERHATGLSVARILPKKGRLGPKPPGRSFRVVAPVFIRTS